LLSLNKAVGIADEVAAIRSEQIVEVLKHPK
jgi:hypothetical protein